MSSVADAQRVRDAAVQSVADAEIAYAARRDDDEWGALVKARDALHRAEKDLELAMLPENLAAEAAKSKEAVDARKQLAIEEQFINGSMARTMPIVDTIVGCIVALHTAITDAHRETSETHAATKRAKALARTGDTYVAFSPPPSLDLIAMCVHVHLERQNINVAGWCSSARVAPSDPLYSTYQQARRLLLSVTPEVDPGSGAEIKRVEVLA